MNARRLDRIHKFVAGCARIFGAGVRVTSKNVDPRDIVRHHLDVDPDVSDRTLATRYSISPREVRQIRATLNADLFTST
jgi:hypothetical protein